MNLKAAGASIKNAFKAFLRGELLMRLGCDRFFPHILYTFLLFWIGILLNIMVENTMSKVEKNKEILTDLKIYHTEKTVQMAGMRRITKTDKMLENKGSNVTFPTKPATRIDAKE